jgi:omega-amidase
MPASAQVAPTLRVAAIQADLRWQNPEANRAAFDAVLDQLSPTDLVVLPEMFNTGFTMHAAELAERENGPTTQWLRERARGLGSVIAGSLIIESGGRYYNRLVWMKPDGEAQTYDKRHLFRLAGEDKHYTAGNARPIMELKGWRIRPLICYDLRFPAWSRRRDDYDVLVYVANWPDRRHQAWQVLLQARAIENQCYLIGVNRVGKDGDGLNYAGGTVIHDALGETVASGGAAAGVVSASLEYSSLARVRAKLPFHLDADEFELR